MGEPTMRVAAPAVLAASRAWSANTARFVLLTFMLFGGVAASLAAGPGDAPAGAASCSGCHPSKRWVDTPVSRLTGRQASAIIAAMESFKADGTAGSVMNRIAKGFTSEEIKAIAQWYAAQKE